MPGFFRKMHHHLVDDIVLIAVFAVLEHDEFQVFFQSALVALVVDA